MSDLTPSEQYKATVRTVYRAAEIAHEQGHEFVTLEHLLLAVLEVPDVQAVLTDLKIDAAPIKADMEAVIACCPVTHTDPLPTRGFDTVIAKTFGSAMFSPQRVPKQVDLLRFITEYPPEDSHAASALLHAGLSAIKLKRFLAHGHPVRALPGQAQSSGGEAAPSPEISSREEAEAYLAQFCTNLNERATESKIDPLIGRTEEVKKIVQIIARRTKNNAVLVGEPGVGKTAIAEGLALKIVRKEVPEVLADCVVYSLDVGNVVAGTRFRGDFEERIKLILKSLTFIPNTILFIDEIHMVLGAGSGNQGSMDVANLLKPALAKGELRCIGSTTQEEYRKHFAKDRALSRRFQPVNVFEPNVEDAKAILRGLKSYYEDFHKVTYTDEAIDAAVELTHRYVNHAFLPDKAIDALDNAGSCQRVAPPSERKDVIGLAEIEYEVSKIAKIPAKTVQEGETEKLLRLEAELKANVVGQDLAQETLTGAVYLSRAGLRDPNKPAGSYLFVGPTGVGKTETAKTLADVLGYTLLRYDMSEYMEKHSVSRLIGSPPGYVGYGEGDAGSGKLTNEVDTHGHCVVLLDEIEKAHPDVLNILLQVMDNGSLTNSQGKTISFRNVILIMTSNVGAAAAERRGIGFGASANDNGAVDAALKTAFTPEFRNRLDKIVHFGRLAPEHMGMIVDKFLKRLEAQSLARDVSLQVSEEARQYLAKAGYDDRNGARPLARVISEQVAEPLSRQLLFGELKNGGTALVNYVAGKIVVSKAESALAA